MYVVNVIVYVKPGHEQDFIDATRKNHLGTRAEPGALRFDVLQGVDDPCRFSLYEVYLHEDGFKAHQQTDHYKTWRETVADWMAKPRQGLRYMSLMPADEGSLWEY